MNKIFNFAIDLIITIVAMLIIKRVFCLFSWDLSNPIIFGIIVGFILNFIHRGRNKVYKKSYK